MLAFPFLELSYSFSLPLPPSLPQLHVEAKEWQEAFALADANPGKFNEAVFLPYAEWLAIEDR